MHTHRGLSYAIGISLLVTSKLLAVDQVVTNFADTGAGSLRQAIADVGISETITFDSSLSGGTIKLSGTQLLIEKHLTIDASSLHAGMTIDADAASRVIQINGGSTVTLRSLTLTGGNGIGAVSSNNGGAVYNSGDLEMVACTIAGNTVASGGGGIFSEGADSEISLIQCTIGENNALFAGGVLLRNSSSVELKHCTVSKNVGTSGTGGVVIESSASLSIENTIIADNEHVGNLADSDIGGAGGFLTRSGNNMIGVQQSYAATLPVGSPNANGDHVGSAATPLNPLLNALGDNGGQTQTMLPMTGSTAIDTVAGGTYPLDQRGYTRAINTFADIGAVEVQPTAVVTIVADSGAGSLRDAIAAAASDATTHTTITFDAALSNASIVLSTGQLLVDKNVKIDASSLAIAVTINGNAASRIMEISSNKFVEIKNVIFTNGKAQAGAGTSPTQGGAIYCGRRSYLVITDCDFASNESASHGGAIYGNDSVVSMLRSDFTSNMVTGGSGGAIYMNSIFASLTLQDSSFSSNSSSDDAGAIYNANGTVVAASTMFTSNSSGLASNHHGGAIFSNGIRSSLTLSQCGFTTNASGSGYGGAIFHERGEVRLNDCSLNGNTGLDGGAIYNTYGARLTILDGSFGGNVGRDGGAIFNTRGTAFITGVTFENNSTTSITGYNGGAIFNTTLGAEMTITDCDIKNNIGGDNGGGIANQFGAKLWITDSRLEGNTSTNDGGCIYIWDAEMHISNSTFSGNIAGTTNGDSGGALYSQGYSSVISFTNCQLLNNSCGDDGGAIWFSAGTMSITDSMLKMNSSGDDAGALYNADGTVNILRSDIVMNQTGGVSGGIGGAIINTGFGASLTITDSDVSSNSCTDDGGGIYNSDSQLTMINTTCSDNTTGAGSGHVGGAIRSSGLFAELVFTGCEFKHNISGDDGGAIWNLDGQITMTDCKVLQNRAGTSSNHYGGGLYNQSLYSVVSLTGCEFDSNTAGDNGGAIYNFDGTFTVANTTFTANTLLAGAGRSGGAVFCWSNGISGSFAFTDCIFSGNSAPDDGGAVYNYRGKIDFLRCRLESNRAGSGLNHFGGAIFSNNSESVISVNDCELINNTSGDDGGGIWNAGGMISVTGSTFANNKTGTSSTHQGGAIFNTNVSTGLKLTNCTFTENVAGGQGGAIHNVNSSLDLLHVTVAKNEALTATGGIYSNSNNVTLENSILVGNTAPAIPDINIAPTEVGSNFTSGDPMLAALGDYGGPTQTMPPLPGSPVIEGTASTPHTIDQRGAVRPNGPLPDIGAVEAFPFSSLALVDSDSDGVDDRIEESYARFTVGVDDSALDSDGDGSTDAQELANMTDPDNAMDLLRIISFAPAAGFLYPSNMVFDVVWSTFPGLDYAVEYDDNLDFSGGLSFGTNTANGFTSTLTVTLSSSGKDFIRVVRK